MSRQSLWLPLLRAALPGTAQAPPPALPLPELAGIAELPAATPEARLLNLAAAVALYQRAGAHQPWRQAELPAVAEPETRALCPEPLLELWFRLDQAWQQARFRQDWRLLQAELIGLLARGGWRFPHRLLPELLEFGREDSPLRLQILPLLGRRGIWLAAGAATEMAVRNPWNWVIDLEPVRQTLPLDIRPAALNLLLRHLRAESPATARELLALAWPRADVGLRTALLPALETGLELADEPFLEACLDDRRRELRTQAQQLLGHVPGSRYLARMQARVAPLLSRNPRKEGEALDLRLPTWPADLNAAALWLRDGLEKASFVSPAGRALVAESLLQLLPPADWLQLLGLDAEQLLDLIEAAEASRQLLSGLCGAVLQFGDAGMAAALLARPGLLLRNPATRLLPLALAGLLRPEQQQLGYLAALAAKPGPYPDVPPEAWRVGPVQALDAAFLTRWVQALGRRLDQTELPAAALLLPPFLILGVAPAQLPLLQQQAQRLLGLESMFRNASGNSAPDSQLIAELDELLALLQARCDLYQLMSQLTNQSINPFVSQGASASGASPAKSPVARK
ncbi:MAG: hypothetical protein CVV27_02475 [Candidatus Melainabacteria bacterium HGW-Melainabacteria-1]|nr:MAG: hypothetical protein CVV27_02475 [Candidatus Melainabacteria bacterium HGW-Melainabacteria-1]